MTPSEFLQVASFFTIGGIAMGWQFHGFEVDRLRAWKKQAVSVMRDCEEQLKIIPRIQERCFHLARTVTELEQRLAKFSPNRPRDANGKFLKS